MLFFLVMPRTDFAPLIMKNRYSYRSKISEQQLLEIVRLFALDLTSLQIAALLHLNRNTVNRYVIGVRRRIAEHSPYDRFSLAGSGDLKIRKIDGVKGRNPTDKHDVVLLFEEGSKVFIALVPRHYTALMQAIMRGKVRADGVMEGLSLYSCRAIGNLHTKKLLHLSSLESPANPADKHLMNNRVNRFWIELRQRMMKFRGIKRELLSLHLSECEFRFNTAPHTHHRLLELLEDKPLF